MPIPTIRDLYNELFYQKDSKTFQANCREYLENNGDINAKHDKKSLLETVILGPSSTQYKLETMAFLLKNKATINSGANNFPDPLQHAVLMSADPVPLIRFLVENGADPDAKPGKGCGLLCLAAMAHPIVQQIETPSNNPIIGLLAAGANPIETLTSIYVSCSTKKYIKSYFAKATTATTTEQQPALSEQDAAEASGIANLDENLDENLDANLYELEAHFALIRFIADASKGEKRKGPPALAPVPVPDTSISSVNSTVTATPSLGNTATKKRKARKKK